MRSQQRRSCWYRSRQLDRRLLRRRAGVVGDCTALESAAPNGTALGGCKLPRDSKSVGLGISSDGAEFAVGADILEHVGGRELVVTSAGSRKVVDSGEVVRELERLARRENSECSGIGALRGQLRRILDLDSSESWRASLTLDRECVGAPGAEHGARVVDQLEGLAAGVGESRLDREVLDIGHARGTGDGEFESGRGCNACREGSDNGTRECGTHSE